MTKTFEKSVPNFVSSFSNEFDSRVKKPYVNKSILYEIELIMLEHIFSLVIKLFLRNNTHSLALIFLERIFFR